MFLFRSQIIAKYEAMMAELVVETNEKEALEKEKQIALESKVDMLQVKQAHPISTPEVHGGSAVLSASSKDLILVEMMNRTHQEKDVRIVSVAVTMLRCIHPSIGGNASYLSNSMEQSVF